MNFSISITGESATLTDADIVRAAQEAVDKLTASGALVSAAGVNTTTTETIRPSAPAPAEEPAP